MPVVRLRDVPEVAFERDGMRLVMQKAIGSTARDPRFIGLANSDLLSVTYIRHWSRHRRMRCDESDRVMFVVEGKARIKIEGEPAKTLAKGDFALIPKGTPYEFSGDFTYLVINAPAFREGSDIVSTPPADHPAEPSSPATRKARSRAPRKPGRR